MVVLLRPVEAPAGRVPPGQASVLATFLGPEVEGESAQAQEEARAGALPAQGGRKWAAGQRGAERLRARARPGRQSPDPPHAALGPSVRLKKMANASWLRWRSIVWFHSNSQG